MRKWFFGASYLPVPAVFAETTSSAGGQSDAAEAEKFPADHVGFLTKASGRMPDAAGWKPALPFFSAASDAAVRTSPRGLNIPTDRPR